MTLTKKLEENKLTIIGTAALLLTLWAGYQSGIFSSQESMEQFLLKTGALAPLCFLFLQTVQVVIPVVPGGVSCIIGVAIFGPVNGFFLNYVGMVTGSVLSFLLARHYGQGFLLKFVSQESFQKYISWTEKGRKFDILFLLALILPGMPDDLLCLIAGLTSMSFKKYLVFTLLGRPFSLFAYSLGGLLVLENLLPLF